MKDPIIQKTLVIIKPDGMQRNLAGEIITRIQRVGLRLVDARMVSASDELAAAHYPTTDEWLIKVGTNALNDCEKYNIDPMDIMGTKDPKELGELVHRFNKEYLKVCPVLAMVFEGRHAIEVVRKLVGPTLPVLAPAGTIRGDYSDESAISANIEKRSIYNLVHASGSEDEAEREIQLWFGKED